MLSQSYFIFQFIVIIIYSLILFIIEKFRLVLQARSTKRTFGDYSDFFQKQKAKHPVTEEAHEMEELVFNSHDFAVRIENVSRLFFNTANEPISAVNCVSLGVKKGSTFGFLGANGAGKTTLIKKITSIIPI
jgi:ABC-type glutathione transport system ATPase component